MIDIMVVSLPPEGSAPVAKAAPILSPILLRMATNLSKTSLTSAAIVPKDTDAIYGWENITCDVTDATSGVDEVYINLTGSSPELMVNIPGTDTYYYNTTLSSGNYSYNISATDNVENSGSSSTYWFMVPPNWDITMDGICNYMDITRISIEWLSTGSNGWIREDINNDGNVNFMDVTQMSLHWLETWP
jgi:hypothetical protein